MVSTLQVLSEPSRYWAKFSFTGLVRMFIRKETIVVARAGCAGAGTRFLSGCLLFATGKLTFLICGEEMLSWFVVAGAQKESQLPFPGAALV